MTYKLAYKLTRANNFLRIIFALLIDFVILFRKELGCLVIFYAFSIFILHHRIIKYFFYIFLLLIYLCKLIFSVTNLYLIF